MVDGEQDPSITRFLDNFVLKYPYPDMYENFFWVLMCKRETENSPSLEDKGKG